MQRVFSVSLSSEFTRLSECDPSSFAFVLLSGVAASGTVNYLLGGVKDVLGSDEEDESKLRRRSSKCRRRTGGRGKL